MHIARTELGQDVQPSFYQLDDGVLSYSPESNTWSGTWLDGQRMETGIAEAIADVEGLRWPDGMPKL